MTIRRRVLEVFAAFKKEFTIAMQEFDPFREILCFRQIAWISPCPLSSPSLTAPNCFSGAPSFPVFLKREAHSVVLCFPPSRSSNLNDQIFLSGSVRGQSIFFLLFPSSLIVVSLLAAFPFSCIFFPKEREREREILRCIST